MKPPISGVALKERTVRDYKRWAERVGRSVDADTLERQAVADLELADAFDRGAVAPSSKPNPEKVQAKRETLAEQASEHGAEIVTGKTIKRELAALHAKARPGSKWSYAMGRLARILQRPALPSREPWKDCEIPALAKKVYRLQAFVALDPMRTQERVGGEVNPFYGLSDRDFSRKFRRLIEDICDESVGRLGHWYVDAGRGRR